MNTPPTVFVVDDDPAVRESLKRFLASKGLGVETYATTEALLEVSNLDRPGCLVVGLRLPGVNGFTIVERLAARDIRMPVLVVTTNGIVEMAARAFWGGAGDYIGESRTNDAIFNALKNAIERDDRMRRQHAERSEIARRASRLTAREQQVMRLVVLGKANKQIAAELGCSGKTIEVHRSRVMEKMAAESVVGLVRMALRLEPPDNDG